MTSVLIRSVFAFAPVSHILGYKVDRGSKAEECGILVGDIVSKVHGVSVKNMTLEQVNRLFELDPRNIALKIKRNSESKSSFGSHTSTRSTDSAPVTDVTLTPSKKRPHTICIKTSKSTDNSNRTSFVDDNNSDIGGIRITV
ncbi:hypothetical protein HELRODRAFT_162299 [Helobdella robusta]|uniref:PDZ domain-containing protein n=1 Tax=Helobdella robusta TaxID=6412 RepID=T1ESH0_HELRO|nr:hypothetical protein HELRODRAFT_162299 [Helobdella robusta]ESN98839.1 hypothetical protein HELRODRAFT_162299 [Helobdella robusta]